MSTQYVYQTLKSLSIQDLRQLNREFDHSTTGNQANLIKRLMVGPNQMAGAKTIIDVSQAKILENILEVGDNSFIKNATFFQLYNLYRTNRKSRDLIGPHLAKKRQAELKKLQTWLASHEKDYTIEQLTNLKRLRLEGDQIQVIPPEIGLLTNLEWLILSENQIQTIPPEISLLTNLKWLYLGSNQIQIIPPEIGQLTNLRYELYLDHNRIKTIPPEISGLTNLNRLDLSHNKIQTIPPEIGQLSNLKNLSLSENQIQTIPPEIGGLNNLRWLDLEDNLITEIPSEIGQLKERGTKVYI